MQSNDWSSYWKKPHKAFNRVMKVSTDYFYAQLSKRYPLGNRQTVLDYGSGPGFLVSNFVAAGVDVTGVDINESFLEHCRSHFPGATFFQVSEDPDATLGILAEKIPGRMYDQIVILSIVQYFQSPQHVDAVIRMLKDYLAPGGKLIVADVLDDHTSSVRDAIGSFLQCVRKGRMLSFGLFVLYLLMSDYRKVSAKNHLLLLSADFMKQVADSCQMRVEELRGMTPHPTRTNYIFTHR